MTYFVFPRRADVTECADFNAAVAERERLLSSGVSAVITRLVLTRVVEVGDPLTPPNGKLSGEALRDLIAEFSRRHDEAFHYRELFAEIEQAGHVVGGKDPIATFLTQLTRVEGIRRVGGNRSGLYARSGAANSHEQS